MCHRHIFLFFSSNPLNSLLCKALQMMTSPKAYVKFYFVLKLFPLFAQIYLFFFANEL